MLILILTISNCKVVLAADDTTAPTIVDMKWSATELKVGDVLEIEVEAWDNESGIMNDGFYPNVSIKNAKTGVELNRNLKFDESKGKYIAKFDITSNMQSGEWRANWLVFLDNAGNRIQYNSWDFDEKYKFNLISSFIGTENKSIKKGESFNPLEGVSAINNIDGDFTNKITYAGNVDTNSEGIYLIKYQAIGDNGYTYNDYRWITVVNNVVTGEDGAEEV